MKKVLCIIFCVVVLVAALVVPVGAVVSSDQYSNVNFADITPMTQGVGLLLSDGVEVSDITYVQETGGFWGPALSVSVSDSLDEWIYTTVYTIVFDFTLIELCPNLSSTAMSNGWYSGIVIDDYENLSYTFVFYDVDTGDIHYWSDIEITLEGYRDYYVAVQFEGVESEPDLSISGWSVLQNPTFLDLDIDVFKTLYVPYDAGVFESYSLGFAAGRTEGYNQGYNQGYSQGYNQGYSQGQSNGYNEGYAEGLVDGAAGVFDNFKPLVSIFSYATFHLVGDTEGEVIYDGEIEPNITNTAISFYEAIKDIQDEWGYFEWCKITITWQPEDYWVFGDFTMSYSGYGDFDVISIYDPNKSKTYYLELVEDLNSPVNALYLSADQSPTYPIYVSSMVIDGMEGAFNQFAIITGSKNYNNGYNAGYAGGYQEGLLATSDEAYLEGRNDGYIAGKQEGLELAEQGDWYNLFTAVVEAPLHVFQSMFNFEILGFNMKNFMMSMFTLCVLVLIVKKIVGV